MHYQQQRPRVIDDKRRRDFWMRNILWCLVTGVGLFLIGWQMNIVSRFKRRNFIQKNSFRFCVIMFFLFIIVASYLLFVTKKLSPGEDRARTMQRDYPIAAYSMTALSLILIVGSFIFFTDILGAFGILFFFCFWGFFINFIFVISY